MENVKELVKEFKERIEVEVKTRQSVIIYLNTNIFLFLLSIFPNLIFFSFI